MMNKKILVFSFVFLLSLAVPFGAHAQSSLGSQLYVTTSPEVPEANKATTISLSYPLSDLSRAQISWYVNNTLRSQGIGEKSISVTLGGAGSRTLVGISITTQEGALLTRTITLVPQTIDILWEAGSRTPPLYKGKALPSRGSTVRLIASPTFMRNGKLLDPASLYYSWDVGGKKITSGEKGAQAVEAVFDKNSSRLSVSVVVSTFDKAIAGKEELILNATAPEVLIYEYSPVSGTLYNKTIPDSFKPTRSFLTLVAEPFFASKNSLLRSPAKWTLDGEIATSGDADRSIVLSRNPQDVERTRVLEFSLSHGDFIGGILKKALTVRF